MLINKTKDSKENDIKTLVDKLVKLYMKEDYNFVVSKLKKGEKVDDITLSEELEFIKHNKLAEGMSDRDVRRAARLAIDKFSEINKSIKFDKSPNS